MFDLRFFLWARSSYSGAAVGEVIRLSASRRGLFPITRAPEGVGGESTAMGEPREGGAGVFENRGIVVAWRKGAPGVVNLAAALPGVWCGVVLCTAVRVGGEVRRVILWWGVAVLVLVAVRVARAARWGTNDPPLGTGRRPLLLPMCGVAAAPRGEERRWSLLSRLPPWALAILTALKRATGSRSTAASVSMAASLPASLAALTIAC